MKGKKGSKLSSIFKDSSDCLAKIERLIKEIRVCPAKGPKDISMWTYYFRTI